VALGASVTVASGSKQGSVAGPVTVRLSIVLGVPPRGERLLALLAAQARAVPVLTQRRHLLGEVDLFVAAWTLRHDGSLVQMAVTGFLLLRMNRNVLKDVKNKTA